MQPTRKKLRAADAGTLGRRKILMTDTTVPLRFLAGLSFLFYNDLQDLALFILRAFDAQSQGTNSRSRPTLHGLATTYARILDVDLDSIERVIQARGLDPGATVEYDT